MKLGIKIGLWLVVLGLSYLVYNSIASKIEFEEETKMRRLVTIQKLKDIRVAQLAHKSVKDSYAKTFGELLKFVKLDSFPVIKAIGTVPDTLSEEEAVQLGLVQRDTSYISVEDSIYSVRYLLNRFANFSVDSLLYIPFGSNGEIFELQAGEIEKGKVKVKVFWVNAKFGIIYSGLDTDNEAIDLEQGLAVGSMDEPSTSGNWGE
ncbi:MAG: hypothetical protein JKX73_01535 [Flavobacteriales bacterium]|nr:hypothetical protein [Flavobacteriales bacterium]